MPSLIMIVKYSDGRINIKIKIDLVWYLRILYQGSEPLSYFPLISYIKIRHLGMPLSHSIGVNDRSETNMSLEYQMYLK